MYLENFTSAQVVPSTPTDAGTHPAQVVALTAGFGDEGAPVVPSQIEMALVNGVWRVTTDGKFYGDFFEKNDAAEAMAKYRGGFPPIS